MDDKPIQSAMNLYFDVIENHRRSFGWDQHRRVELDELSMNCQ